MPLGTCKLCLAQGVDLQLSHLIPAGAYRAIRNFSGEPPIVMKSAVTIKKDEQIRDYLLCANCEQRFNDNGERWVLQHCNQFDAGFPLNDLIEQSTPVEVKAGFALYAGNTIAALDIEKLAYFPSSVLWRGSVHDWCSGRDAIRTPKLGPYEEELRKYLLGEASFPTNAVLFVDVLSEPNLWHSVYLPYGRREEDLSWHYTFPFLGILFAIVLGKTIKPTIRRFCTYRSPENFITKGLIKTETLIQAFGKLRAKSRKVGKL
jgi:hypothetical protein